MSHATCQPASLSDSALFTTVGGYIVLVNGPYMFPIEVLTRQLVHTFYVIKSPAPFIAGFDLVIAAQLIIDAIGRTVYMLSTSTNTFVSA